MAPIGCLGRLRARCCTVGSAEGRWVADLTYVAIAAGFVYVAVILDAWTPGRLVAPRRRLRHRPNPLCPAHRRRLEGRDRAAPAATRLRSPLRSRLPIRGSDLPRASGGASSRRLDGPPSQSLRQCQGRKLHEDVEGRGALPDGLRDVRGRRGRPAALHRPNLQRAPPAFRARLSQPGAVRGPTHPASGQNRRVSPVHPQGATPHSANISTSLGRASVEARIPRRRSRRKWQCIMAP